MNRPSHREIVAAVLRGDTPVVEEWLRQTMGGWDRRLQVSFLLGQIHKAWQKDARLIARVLELAESDPELRRKLSLTLHRETP